ncbi:MAG: sulfatase-like hydrolase/transferase [Verrucomicrobiota bacterium]
MVRATLPNILVVVADDHESRAIKWAGNKAVETPHFDRLAAQGTAFTRAYHNGGFDDAVCIPTRASLLTGMDNFGALRGGRDVINPDCTTLPERFRHAGYHCFVTGKWHNDRASLARSFDSGEKIFLGGMYDHFGTPVRPFDPTGVFPESAISTERRFSADAFCETAAHFIHDYDEDAPFFAYVALTTPHDPRTPPAGDLERYPADSITLPPNFEAEHPFDLGVREIRDECLAPYPRTPERIQEEIAAYYGMISATDRSFGKIIAALQARDILDNTIIVYTGDHGLAVGQHGLLGKQNVYEHSCRVPLIIAGPGVPAGQTTDALAYSWDIFPTLCDLCHLEPPTGLDARSLSPVLENPAQNHREAISTHYMGYHRMVTEHQWKLIFTRVNDVPRQQLFDLVTDPNETNNLIDAPDCAAHAQRLLARMQDSPAGLPSADKQPCY